MPRFQIKRKTREAKPEVVPEEKIDETEMSLESSDESSEESEPLVEQFETLEIEKKKEIQPKQQTKPQYDTPRRTRETSVAQYNANVDQYGNPRQTYAPQRGRQLGQRRPIEYPRPSRSANGRPHLQYRSLYGPNSQYLSTQDKARSLYYSCFG